MAVILGAGDPDDSDAVLRQMVRDKAALTPPTALAADVGSATPEAPTPSADVASPAPDARRSGADEEEAVADKLGRATFVLVVLGVPAWLVVRAARHRRRPGLASEHAASSSAPAAPSAIATAGHPASPARHECVVGAGSAATAAAGRASRFPRSTRVRHHRRRRQRRHRRRNLCHQGPDRCSRSRKTLGRSPGRHLCRQTASQLLRARPGAVVWVAF